MKNKGITLIALVVTIVVLLILAGVSITAVFGKGGIIALAQEAADKTKETEENDEKNIKDLADELNSLLNGGETEEDDTTPEIKLTSENIGDTINYKPSGTSYEAKATDTGLSNIQEDESDNDTLAKRGQNQTITPDNIGWKIWDIEDDTLTLISDAPTTQKLYLYGAEGYNNGVYLLNKICEANYTNAQYKGIEVRNLNELDIQKEVINEFSYGEGKEYNIDFPNIYIQQDVVDTDGTMENRHKQEALVHGTGKGSYMVFNVSSDILKFKEEEKFNILYNGEQYFLSSRMFYTQNGSSSGTITLSKLDSDEDEEPYIYIYHGSLVMLWNGQAVEELDSGFLRPIVKIPLSSCKITEDSSGLTNFNISPKK